MSLARDSTDGPPQAPTPLVVFRSRAAAEIIMFAPVAQRLLELSGKTYAERGVITSAQIAGALHGLEQALTQERAAGTDVVSPEQPLAHAPVSLRQRAFPLIEMLRAAQKRGVDVTWGV